MLFKHSVEGDLLRDPGLAFQLIAKRCLCCHDGPGGELNDISGVKKKGAQMKGPDVRDEADHTTLLIDKNSVDGKAHKEHMDGSTFCDNKRFACSDLIAPQKPFHARPERIGQAGVLGNDRILAFVKYLHERRAEIGRAHV